jgi:class 3 adenylate cyclase/alpha-beta hydrolase superfamily lysophospholipase
VLGEAVQSETKYTRLGRDRIAYQVFGAGPPSLIMISGSFGHVDALWEDAAAALFLRTLASFAQVIRFDRRGTGASDPVPLEQLPPWESHAEELAAVLDEVGSDRVALMAQLDGGPLALFFAATRPERVSAVVLSNTTAKFAAADDYPIGILHEVAEALVVQVERAWGTEALASMQVPSRADDARFRRWYAKLQRAMASPSAVAAYARAIFQIDVRALLPLIQAPTLVLHRSNGQLPPIEHGRYLAQHIPGAKLVELPGVDGPVMWETPELALDLIEEFLGGVRRTAEPNRVLATVLFTDIVDSTKLASRLGDRRWRELLNTHDDVSGQLVEEFNGRLVETTGDGILATFDGPGRGIRCAAALGAELRGIGIQIRAGLHTGEVELRGDGVGGIAVHIAARVMAAAGSGEILTSRTVRDLVVGSDIALQDHGTQPLKGVEGNWELFSVVQP